MKSPFRKSPPAKRLGPESRKIKSKRRPSVRSERGLHLIGLRQSTHQRRGESLGDFAYRIMREAIRSGKFRSGEHLREADVAKWLNISRTPVREAFHRIISEGLLTNGPWNGVMVADLDSQQLVQLYAVRAALEGTAAALAAQHATKTEVQHLFQIAKSEARAKNDPAKLVIINSELHQMLYAAAHNRYLLQSITTVVDALGLLRHSTFVLPGSIELAHREHLQIITAIRDRKSAAAERLAREHINHALAMRLELQRLRSDGS
jgi:DNA-binding GntR family transcriptional regulator